MFSRSLARLSASSSLSVSRSLSFSTSSSAVRSSPLSRLFYILLGSTAGVGGYYYFNPDDAPPSIRSWISSVSSSLPASLSLPSSQTRRVPFSWEALEALLKEYERTEAADVKAWHEANARKAEEAEKARLLSRYESLRLELDHLTSETSQAIQQKIKQREREIRSALMQRVQAENGEFFSYIQSQIRLAEDKLKGEELSGLGEKIDQVRNEAEKKARKQWGKRVEAELARMEALFAVRGSQALEDQRVKLLESLQSEVETREGWAQQLDDSVAVFEQAFNDLTQYQFFSHRVHQLSLSMIALEELIPKGEFSSEWAALAACGASDPIIGAALDSVPDRVAASGVQTLESLQSEFSRLERPVRTAVYYHEFHDSNWPTLSRLVARFFAGLTISDRALVDGDSEQQKLARASYWLLKMGNLAKALQEIESLKPENRVLLNDWLKGAKERAVVEQAMGTVKARILTLSLKFGADPIDAKH